MQKNKLPDICTFGSITVDIFLHPPELSEIRWSNTDGDKSFLALPAEEKIQIQHVIRSVGGGAANTAVGFGKMGLLPAVFGTIGRDENAEFIKKVLKKNGIDTQHIHEEKESSSFSVILTSYSGKRTVLHHRAMEHNFDIKTLEKTPKSRALYIGHLYDREEELLFGVPDWKKRTGGMVVWNPGKTQFHTGFKAFQKIFPQMDYLILNREEAEAFTGISAKNMFFHKTTPTIIGKKIDIGEGEHVPQMLGDLRAIAKKFLSAGVQTLIITDGRNGAQLFHNKTHLLVPTCETPPVCTLGAGDAFSVGVITAALQKKDFPTQLLWGHRNATAVVAKFGAQEGQLTQAQLTMNSKQ
jgi:2-dehydro-3-deoxygluconokinase